MKFIIVTLTLILLFGFGHSLRATDSLSMRKIEFRLEQLDTQLKEVRNNQLNYQIEKNLLKESYSNSFNTVGYITTLLLAFFTLLFAVLGFLGIKDINTLKEKYEKELEELKVLKNAFDKKSEEFEKSKEKIDNEISDIIKRSEELNKKVSLTELKEKIDKLTKDASYDNALEICENTLEAYPQNTDILIKKALIFTKLMKYSIAREIYQEVIALSPKDELAIVNLAEILLFEGNQQEYTNLITKQAEIFTSMFNKKVLEYLNLLSLYNKGETDKLKQGVLDSIDRNDLLMKSPRIPGWGFLELSHYLLNRPRDFAHQALSAYGAYMNGDINSEEALRYLGEK